MAQTCPSAAFCRFLFTLFIMNACHRLIMEWKLQRDRMRLTVQYWLVAIVLLQAPCRAWAYETVPLRQLPNVLRTMWSDTKPQMNENSRCAAAFDNQYDLNKMTMRCSIYMRMGAEAERRAISYCEQDRARKTIAAPCRIVTE